MTADVASILTCRQAMVHKGAMWFVYGNILGMLLVLSALNGMMLPK